MFFLPRLVARTSRPSIRTLSLSGQLLKDYYKILGIPKNANGKDVKKAYYQLAKQFHPDTNKGDPLAESKFQEVSEAYEVLGDDTKRGEYDSYGGAGGFDSFSSQGSREQPFSQSRQGRGPGGAQWSYKSNVDPEELFKTIFGEFTRRGGAGGRGFQNPFDDIFSNFNFRGGSEAVCHISFTEAAKGINKEVEFLEMSQLGGVGKKLISVPIPAGISDGQTLRMSLGQGREVFITVRVEESDYFRREGHDVHTTSNISISQALLGGIIRVRGLYEDINLRIPAGTSSHTAMTLSSRGIKHMESFQTFGDHVVHIVIKLPVRMTEEQKELIREFAYTEKDTPGTVTGVDKENSRWRRGTSSNVENDSSTQTSAGDNRENTDIRGTLQTIGDAISNNKTVVKIKKAIFG